MKKIIFIALLATMSAHSSTDSRYACLELTKYSHSKLRLSVIYVSLELWENAYVSALEADETQNRILLLCERELKSVGVFDKHNATSARLKRLLPEFKLRAERSK